MNTKKISFLSVAAMLLAVICVVGAGLLLCRRPAEPSAESGSAAEPGAAALPADTAPAETETTVFSAAATAAATETLPAETEPPTAEACYMQFLEETLLPEYGLAAANTPAFAVETAGIAGAYVCDFLGSGSSDLLVIRLDVIEPTDAAVPVLLWYTRRGDRVLLADTFESKLPWAGWCLRYDAQTLYLSGEWMDAAHDPESRKCTEISVQMQEKRDMVLLDMEQGTDSALPEKQYPEQAALLLEMQQDFAAQTEMPQYLLRDYTGMRRLLSAE